MLKQIKRISLDDYNKLAIVFTDEELLKYSILENDKLDLEDMFLIEGDRQ